MLQSVIENIKIRQAKRDDINQLLSLTKQCYPDTFGIYTMSRMYNK